MRRFLTVLLIIVCVMAFAGCASKNVPADNNGNETPSGNDGNVVTDEPSATPTPAPNGQEQGTATEGETVEPTPMQGTVTFAPIVTTEPGVDLEEDILTDDEPTVTNKPTTAPTVAPTNQGQATATPETTVAPTVTPTATPKPTEAPKPTATAQTTDKVISLPMDIF